MPKQNVAFKMKRDNYTTKYLKNVLRSLGMSTKEYLADIAPNIAETAKTGAEISKNIYMNINRNKAGINRINGVLQNNRYLKAMNDAYKNALTDLKTGNFNNQERAMEAFMGESGSDGFSFGDDDLGYSDESTINVDTGATQAVISMTQQSRENTASQIKMMKASTDAIIASSTVSLQASQQLGTDILGRLDNINNNLSSIVKYQSENMTKFIEASIAYYDKAGQAANQQLKEAEEKLTGADVLNGSKGGINMSRYKQYVKQQLKKTLSNSSVGFIADMLDDDMLSMISSNPLGFATKALTEYMMPKVVTESIKSMEQAYSNFAPTMLAEISKLSKSTDTGISGMLKRFIGDTFGIKGSDPNDRKIGAKIQKGPTPFDNETKIAITQIITKELREQTSYLRVLTEKIGGTKGYEKAKGYENYFDYHEGRFYQGREKIDDKIANEIIQSIANGFSGTKFGQSLNSLAINQSTDSKRKEMQKIIDRIYVEIEKNKDNVTLNDVLSIVTNLGLNNKTENILKNYIENMARKTPDDFNSLNIGRLLANQQADRAVKDISQNYQDWNLLSSSFNTEALSGPDSGKEIRKILDESFRRNRDNNVKRFRGLQIRSNNTLKEDYGKNPIAVATGYLVDSMNSILSGNLGNISNLTTNFFKDELSSIAKRTNVFLFGKKTSTKEREGGVFSEVINKTKDYLFGNVVDETGKRDKSGFFGQVTSGWMEGIFGKKKDNETDEEMHERVIGGIKDKANKLLKEKFPEFFKKYGKDIGVGAGAGLIASVIGGPIAGATVGIASGLVNHSGMVGRFLFGEDYTDKKGNTKHRNGLFENIAKGFSKGNQHKVTKKELGMNLTGMLGGALTASMIGKMGVIGAALTPLGPLGGAILGLGASISAQSGKLHEILFGKDVTDSKGNKFHEAGIPGQILNQFKTNIIKPLASTVTTGVNRLLLRVEHHILTPISLLAGFVTKRVTAMFTGGANLLGRLVRGIATAPFRFIKRLSESKFLGNTLGNLGGFATKVGGSMLSLPGRFIGGTLGLIGGKELRQQWNLSQEIFRDRMKALNAERKAEKQRIRQDQAITKLTGGKFGEDTEEARMYLEHLDKQSGGRTKLRENFEKKFGKDTARNHEEYKKQQEREKREREAQDAEIQQRDALINPESTQNKLLSGIKDSIVDLKDSLLGMFRGLTRRQDSTDTRINHVEHQRTGLENIISNFHRNDDDSFEMESGGHGIGSALLGVLGAGAKAVGSGIKKVAGSLSAAGRRAKSATAKVLRKAGLNFKSLNTRAAADGTSAEELAQAREKEEEHNFREAVLSHFETVEENQEAGNTTVEDSISPKKGILTLAALAAAPFIIKHLPQIMEFGKKAVTWATEVAWPAIKTAWGYLKDIIDRLLGGLGGGANNALNQLINTAQNAERTNGNTLNEQLDAMRNRGLGNLSPWDENGKIYGATDANLGFIGTVGKLWHFRNAPKLFGESRISKGARAVFSAAEKGIKGIGKAGRYIGESFTQVGRAEHRLARSQRAANKALAHLGEAGGGTKNILKANRLLDKVDEAAEALEGAKAIRAAKIAEGSANKGLLGKVTEFIKNFYDDVAKRFAAKYGDDAAASAGKMASTIFRDCPVGKVIASLNKVWGSIVDRIVALLGGHVSADAVSFGLAEVVFATISSVNTISGTAQLFRVEKNKVDGTMRTIAGILGALVGTTPGAILDLVFAAVGSVLGIDILNCMAVGMYNFVNGKNGKAEALKKATDEYHERYNKERDENLTRQLEGQKAIGAVGKDVTLEQFKQGIATNKYNAKYDSYQDWNVKQDKTIGGTIASGLGKGWNATKRFFAGDETYTLNGINFVKNSNGLYSATINGQQVSVDKATLEAQGATKSRNTSILSQGLSKAGIGLRNFGSQISNRLSGIGNIPSLISNTGRSAKNRASDLFTGLISNINNSKFGKTAASSISSWLLTTNELDELASAGDVKGVFEYAPMKNVDTNNPIGKILHGLLFANKILHLPSAGISAVGNKLFDKFKSIAKDVSKTTSRMTSASKNMALKTTQGDVKGLWQINLAPTGNSANPLENTASSLLETIRLVSTVPAGVSWAGHQLWNKAKQALGVAKSSINQLQSNNDQLQQYSQQGDISGLWSADTTGNISQDNPIGNIVNFASYGQKALLSVPAIVNLLGGKLKPIVERGKELAKSSANQLIQNNQTLNTYLSNGDVKGLWSTDLSGNADENNPLGDVLNFASYGQKALYTVPTILKWVGNGASKILNRGLEIASSSWDQAKANDTSLNQAMLAGDLKTLWNSNTTAQNKDSDNPLSGFMDGVSIVSKVMKTPVALVISAGNSISKFINNIFGKASSALNSVEESAATLSGYAESGDIESIKNYQLAASDEKNIFSAIGNAMVGISKMIFTIPAAFNKFGNWVRPIFKGLVDTLWNGKSGDASVQELEAAYTNNTTTATTGGSGFGGAGDSYHGATYYSQNDSRWKDAGYNTGADGATMGTTGCGPTALSMVMSDVTGSKINPMQMAGLAKATGDRDSTGTNWNFIGKASSMMGVPSYQAISPSAGYISSELDRGHQVLLSGRTGGYGRGGGYGGSAYTPAGHYVVAVGKDANGNILVNDPRGKGYSRKYDPEALAAETGSSWSFGGSGPLDIFNNSTLNLPGSQTTSSVNNIWKNGTPDTGNAAAASSSQRTSIQTAVPATGVGSTNSRGYSSSTSGIGSEGANLEAARARAVSKPAASKWNPHAGMAYEPGKGAVNNKGQSWMDVVRACKKAISEASGGKYSKTNYVKVTMDGVEYSVRTDCSGFVSFCLKVMGILANNTNLSSANFTSSCTTLTNNGFTYMDWPGWEGLKEGDIIAEPGSHVEIFSRHDGNDDYVYNVGSNSSASAEGETKDGHTHNYKTVFRPDPSLRSKNGVGEYATGGSAAGGSEDGSGGATADSSSDATVAGNTSGASEQKEGIWSKLTTGISNFMSAAFDRMVSGDWSNTNYDDVFYPNRNKGTSTTGGATSDGSSSGSNESSGSSSGGSTSGGTESGSSSGGAISMYNVKSIKNIAEAEERLDSLGLDNKKRNFYKSILPATMQSYSETGVLPSLTLAQGAIESGWGESGLAKRYNNYFGMKAGKSWKGAVANLKTKEEYKAGSPVTITDGFRVYSSPSESVLDHGKLLTNPRYAEVINRSKALDAMGAVQAVKDAGYATSSTYVQTVGGRVKGDKLYELDKFTPVVGDSGDKSSEGYSTSMSGIGSEGANLEAARARAQGGAGISIPKRKLNTGGKGIGEAIAQLSQNNPFTSVINGLNNNLISKSPSIIQNGNIARNNTNINTTPGMGATNQQVDLSQVINLLSQLVTYSASSDTKLDMLGALNNIQGGNNLFVANGGNGGPNKWMMSNPNGNTAMRRGDSIAAAIATGGF